MVRSWDEIEKTYLEYIKSGVPVHAMLSLVHAIESSPYINGLYAWTSMHNLCMVQQPVSYPYHGPYLRITPLFNGKAELRYIDTYKEEKQWVREVAEEELFIRLEQIIERLHWFV